MTGRFLSKGDLGERWGVSPQAVNNWERRHSDFPPEAFRVGKGKIPVYDLKDVEHYEKRRGLAKQEEEQ